MLVCTLFGVLDGGAMGLSTAEGAVVTPGGEAGVIVTGAPLLSDVIRKESPDLILDTVDQRITKMRPSATPLDQILRHATSRTAKTMQFGYYSVDIRGVKATTTAAIVAVTTSDTAELPVDNVRLFAVSDTLYIPSKAGFDDAGVATPTKQLVLYVCAVGAASLTVQAVNGQLLTNGSEGMYVPSIASGTALYRLGRAAAEGDVRTSPFSALPTKQKNFCQIFKCEVAESTIAAMSDKEVQWTPNDIEEQAMYEWRMGMEASFLFGAKRRFFDPIKKAYVYTTGGVVNSIAKHIEYKAVMDNPALIDITKQVFTGNSGSRRRILFAGSGLVANFSSIGTVEKQLEAGNTVVVWGIEWKEIKTNFGTLLLLQHDLLDMYGWEDKGIILDPACLDKWTFSGVERLVVDTKKSGTFDGNVAVITEIAGAALKYPSVHAVLSPAPAA